jgi:hypothetical protein
MPALKQIIRILLLLVAACLFLLVDAVLASAQSFQDFAFPISLAVSAERYLSKRFEFPKVRLQFLAKVQQVLAQHGGELQIRSRASGAQAPGVGLGSLVEGALQSRECFLGARDLEVSFL